jgi:hypothetical protein
MGFLLTFIALLAGLLLYAPDVWHFLTDTPLERAYRRIADGMTLPEVEAIMGKPGRELKQEELPRSWPDIPVVRGDHFYEWTGPVNGQEVHVELRDGRVCDKSYWEYSL